MVEKRRSLRVTVMVAALVLALTLCSFLAACGPTEKVPPDGGGGSHTNDEEYWVEKIEVVQLPSEASTIGSPFNTEGMIIKATWNDGYVEENVSPSKYVIEPAGNLPEGTTEVTVIYGDATVKVPVTSMEITGLSVYQKPNVTTYTAGEKFDPAGLILKWAYSNGATAEIADFDVADVTFADKALTPSDKSVAVTYAGYTVEIAITVSASGVKIEAESAQLTGKYIKKKSEQDPAHWMLTYASGGDFVSDVNATDKITITVDAAADTQARLYVQGASNWVNLNPPTLAKDLVLSKVMEITVNSRPVPVPASAVFKGKDNKGKEDKWLWVQWATADLGIIDLNKGTNTITFTFKNPDGQTQPYDAAEQYGDAVGQYDYFMLEYV